MRVLICDQDSELLDSLGRTFEVEVATSKATCIDLMRANPFDVLVAGERLTDGSGLELLSHVANRWPDTLRVLSIAPDRMRLLRGKLAPFRLHATLNYPIDEDELERVFGELWQLIAGDDEEIDEDEPVVSEAVRAAVTQAQPGPAGSSAAATSRPAAQAARPSASATAQATPQRLATPSPVAVPADRRSAIRPPAPGATMTGSAASSRVPNQPLGRGFSSSTGLPGSAGSSPPKPAAPTLGNEMPAPLRRRLGTYTPLGAPEDGPVRILGREFDTSIAPLAARAIRARELANRPKTPAEKLKKLSGKLRNLLKR